MAERTNLPFLEHPEIKASQKEIEGAISLEQQAWEYKIKREERNAIFDEVKTNLHYRDIASLLNQEISPERFNEPVRLKDFINIWQQNPRAVLEALAKSIKTQESESVLATAPTKRDIATEHNIQRTINARTIGKLTRLAYLLQLRFTPLTEQLNQFDLDQIDFYGATQWPPAKTAVKQLVKIKHGVDVAKLSKTTEGLRRHEEVARLYQVDPERVRALNDLLGSVTSEVVGQSFHFGIEQLHEEEGTLVEKEFLPAYINYRKEMKQLHDLLERGKIVETDYVKELIEYALPALRKNPPTIVYFHGDFGTGKTALAVHIARTRFGQEPVIVAGNKYLEPDRFTEDFRVTKLSEVEFFNSLARQLGIDQQFKPDAPIEEVMGALVGSKQEIRKRIIDNIIREDFVHSLPDSQDADEIGFQNYKEEVLLAQGTQGDDIENLKKAFGLDETRIQDVQNQLNALFSNQIMGRYVMGAMYEAMNTGRPLIIDEANAISPEVLIAFNDLITKKIGEKISVRADVGNITVKEGYCIMWTGNTGERYKQARYNDMDPATYSRILPIQVRYLPQSREVSNMAQLLERLKLDKLSAKTFAGDKQIHDYVKKSHKEAGGDQIFQVLLLKLLNSRLGAELMVKTDNRYSLFEDLYRLSVGARLIMDLFEGNPTNFPRLPNLDKILGNSTTTVLTNKLKKANLTMRELIDSIIGSYIDESGSMDLEFYLWKYIKKYDMSPEDQAIIYAIMKQVGFFAESDGWPNPAAITVTNLNDFEKIMNFNPTVQVTKYKQIKKNGEYVSLLNTGGRYQIEYFSSPEMLQLLFGFLPPRRKAEYVELKKAQERRAKIPELMEKQQKLLTELSDIIGALTAAKIMELFGTPRDIANFNKEYRNQTVSQSAFLSMSSEEQLEATEIFYNFLLESMKLSDKISKADLEAGLEGSVETKASIIKKALGQE